MTEKNTFSFVQNYSLNFEGLKLGGKESPARPASVELTRVKFSDGERLRGRAFPETVSAAVAVVRETGAVYLENVFDPAFVGQLREAFMARYSRYFKEDLYSDALPVGHRRMMITIDISGIFNQAHIYANPLVYPVLQGLLGPKLIMGGFGSVTSLPGASEQHMHRDHPPLFGDFDYQHKAPSFALTVAIPMIDITHETGTTRLYPGTHRLTAAESNDAPSIDPVAPVGSVFIWDYLLYHGGTANRSDDIRPLLYFSYCRPWFFDSENYSIQNPIMMSDDEYAKVPEVFQQLFRWALPRAEHDWSKVMLPDKPCPCGSNKPYKDCHGGSAAAQP